MEDALIPAVNLVAPAFLIIALGYVFNLIFKIEVEPLVKLSMTVLVPAFAFVHLYRMDIDPNLLSTVFISAWIIILAPGILVWFLLRNREAPMRGLLLSAMFMNSVNLPFPILLSAFGEEAMPYALMFYLASLLGLFTLGLLVASGGQGSLTIFRQPVVYVMGLALWMNHQEWPLPPVLETPVALLESATIPMVLLILGMQLVQTRPAQLNWSLLAVGFRFAGGFLAGWGCVWFFGLDGLARKVVMLESVMPTAAMAFLIAQNYQADVEVVASALMLSTLMALGILPVLLYWLA